MSKGIKIFLILVTQIIIIVGCFVSFYGSWYTGSCIGGVGGALNIWVARGLV